MNAEKCSYKGLSTNNFWEFEDIQGGDGQFSIFKFLLTWGFPLQGSENLGRRKGWFLN